MTQLNVKIPDSLMKDIKTYSAIKGVSIQKIVTDLLSDNVPDYEQTK